MFANRLEKRYKHLNKWARRSSVSCFRAYDRDIPEIPLSCDVYGEADSGKAHLLISLYERPYEKDEDEEERWLEAMKLAASDILSIPLERVTTRMRKRQRGEQSQYERQSEASKRIVVMEGGSRFIVDLSAYLDTGLFLDHRPARLMVRERARGKSVLNLFCYTGAFSVHAACAGATKVTSVDLSKTYLAWAQDNFRENGLNAPYAVQDAAQGASQGAAQGAAYAFVHMDVRIFLNNALKANERWDIIILDPPTFSNSKRASEILDINRDWASLCRSALALLTPGGTLFFSTNSRSLVFDPSAIGGACAREGTVIRDLTAESIPEDFRSQKIHRLWTITTAADGN